MAKKTDEIWDVPPLTPDDQRLVDAYREVGRPVDQLPYTTDFDKLMQHLGKSSADNSERQFVFQRLLQLRKKGRLPRIGVSELV